MALGGVFGQQLFYTELVTAYLFQVPSMDSFEIRIMKEIKRFHFFLSLIMILVGNHGNMTEIFGIFITKVLKSCKKDSY